ncbi:MAG TPA: fibronectin type III domain-containing protein [Geobacteraceae bacterium]
MKYQWRQFSTWIIGALLCLALSACGSSTRFDPGPAGAPTGLTAAAGNGQVALSWSPATPNDALFDKYDVYYSTSPGVTTSTGTKFQTGVSGTSIIVTGLTNGVTYYFAVAAINAEYIESPLSNEVAATPAAPNPFQQSDLQGTWYFNVLVNGTGAGWMHGIATIDAAGIVTVTSFLDNAGSTTAPAGLFTTMTILPDGTVSQSGTTDFHGVLSNNQFRDMLVGTASTGGTSRMVVVLQKRVPGITYTASDIRGTGRFVAGPLPFVYHQLSSGIYHEWQYATGQIGQDQGVTYLSLNSPTPTPLPGAGNKVVTLSITADGIVTETPIAGVVPQPTALITWGVMSADKMTIVGTATDSSGALLIRIIQFVHPPSVVLTSSVYVMAHLVGTYGFHDFINGTSPLWANGDLTIEASGTATYATYLDSSGSTVLPAPQSLSLDQQGILTESGNPSYNGQLSYFNDMFVATRTDAPGVYSLSIDLKR